jgi:hypothetical protein
LTGLRDSDSNLLNAQVTLVTAGQVDENYFINNRVMGMMGPDKGKGGKFLEVE